MPDFSKNTYQKEANFSKVKFGRNSILLETELNELQDILTDKQRDFIKNYVGDKVLNKGTYSYSNGVFSISNEVAFVDGNVINISNLQINAQNGDTIYLKVWEEEVTYQSSLKKYGNEQETEIENKILDTQIGKETARRVQLKYTLSLNNNESNCRYLKLGTISSGNFSKESLNVITNVENVISEINSVKSDVSNIQFNMPKKDGTLQVGLNAEKVGGKTVSELAPASHTHTKADITDFAHTHNINEIMNLPNERLITICTSTTRPSNPVEGQHIYETDTKKTMKWTGNTWQVVGYEDFTPPATITNFTAVAGNAQISLNWTNPTDSDFSKVKIVRKVGSYPTSHTDGTVVYEGTGTSYIDTGLTNGTTYYYRAFTFDVLNNINTTTTNQQINATPHAYVIYGVRIAKANSNPFTSVEYTDDAVGFTPASGNNGKFQWGSWQDKFPFKDIKPCVLKSDGTVNYYLNPNDFTKKVDGSAADITSGNDGDVMIEFPKVYWYIYEDDNYYYVKISNAKVNDNFKCLAHTKGSTEKDKIYIGAYLGWYDGSKLRSLSGKSPTVNITIGTARDYAQARAGWEQFTYYRLLMLQCLFVIMFKSLDSQTALGRGYVDGNPSATSTGGTNTKGMFYGETTGKQQMKFCGIEDLWGNCYQWIDGIYCYSNRNILIATTGYNNTGSGYTNYGQVASFINGYIDKIQGTTEKGFIAKSTSGSATTYFCDYGHFNFYADRFVVSGGSWNYGNDVGCFSLNVSYYASDAYSNIAARCCFVG